MRSYATWPLIARFMIRDSAPGRELGSYWRKGKVLLLVPAQDVADRILRLVEVVETLSAFERRGQLLVYRDLLAA